MKTDEKTMEKNCLKKMLEKNDSSGTLARQHHNRHRVGEVGQLKRKLVTHMTPRASPLRESFIIHVCLATS